MPVTGLPLGVSARPWAQAWLNVRVSLGMNAKQDGCLMRDPLANGKFSVARNQPGQATVWLRHLLLKLGALPQELLRIGSIRARRPS